MPSASPQSTVRNPKSTIHWPSAWQLTLSLIAALTLWALALTLGLMGLSSFFGMPNDSGAAAALPLVLTAAGMGFGGVLLLPSAALALARILQRPFPIRLKIRRPGLSFLALPLVLGLGYIVTQNPTIALFSLPILHILAVGLSMLWLLSLALRGLSPGSAQRAWGVFGTGLVLAPLFSLVVELIAILLVGFLGLTYLARDPQFAAELTRLSQEILNKPDIPPERILNLLEPFLLRPVTMYMGLLVGAGLVPLIEELFKPIGVWLLAGRKPTPAQGFAAGVLSGAGFALFENLTLTASSGEEWSFVILARLGTTMIHILTTGLTGWALALAWGEKRYLRLGLTYLSAVVIHGLWNGLVILSIIPEILPQGTSYPEALTNIGSTAPLGFFVLAVGGFVLLLGCNLNLRRALILPVYAGTLGESGLPDETAILEKSQPELAANSNVEED